MKRRFNIGDILKQVKDTKIHFGNGTVWGDCSFKKDKNSNRKIEYIQGGLMQFDCDSTSWFIMDDCWELVQTFGEDLNKTTTKNVPEINLCDELKDTIYGKNELKSTPEVFIGVDVVNDSVTQVIAEKQDGVTTVKEIREFSTGALRDTSSGKVEPIGFTDSKVEMSYFDYMQSHRKMKDGTIRDSDNWKKGFGLDVTMHSFSRHARDLEAIHQGYKVYELDYEGEISKHYLLESEISAFETCYDGMFKIIDKEECINACKFNLNAHLKEYLEKEQEEQENNK